MFGFKIITQYEQGVVFRFGRVLPGIRPPGLTWVNPFTDRLRKVNMQILVVSVPAQEAITLDNVTVRVDAVVYYRVVNPVKAIINVQDYHHAVAQVALTSLRSVIGENDLDQLLSGREKVNAHLKDVIDAPTEEPWGILVERVELKDISLPESMKRSMSRQAEAERERRARVIAADGEVPGIGQARRGRHRDGRRPGRPAAAAAADRRRGRGREEQHPGHALPGGTAALLRQRRAVAGPGAGGSHHRQDSGRLAPGSRRSRPTTASLPAGDLLAGQLNGITKASAGQRMLPGKPGPKRHAGPPSSARRRHPRISAAPQIASMISSSSARRAGELVWPLMQYEHWVTCAAATAISCLVLAGSAPSAKTCRLNASNA